MNTPLVSVVMPVYNAARFVGEAIRSVLAQNWSDFELIVIDDASTDGSREVLAGFTDRRCRVFANPINLGAAETKSRGLAEARGEFIAFLDADDLAMPQRFATQIDWLRAHPAVSVLGTSIEHIDCAGQSLGRFDLSELEPRALRARLLFRNRLAQSGVMLRREALGQFRFRKEFEPAEDYDLWVRLAAKADLAVMPEVLVRYRIHDQSVSATKTAAMQRAIGAIHAGQVREFGLTDSDGLHAVTVATDPVASLKLLDTIAQWLLTLQQANRECELHDARVFDAELRARWIEIGARAHGLGLAGWNRWGRAPFGRKSAVAGLRLFGRALRWELARRLRRS